LGENFPEAHWSHSVVPFVAANVPGGQKEHELPPWSWRYRPASQGRQAEKEEEFVSGLKRPEGQSVQGERSFVSENLPEGHVSHSVRDDARPEPGAHAPHIIQSGADGSPSGHGMHGAALSPEKTKPVGHEKQRRESWGPVMVELDSKCVSRAPSWRALAAYSLGHVGWIVTAVLPPTSTSSPLPLKARLFENMHPKRETALSPHAAIAPPCDKDGLVKETKGMI
jgi:hypothetical protein